MWQSAVGPDATMDGNAKALCAAFTSRPSISHAISFSVFPL